MIRTSAVIAVTFFIGLMLMSLPFAPFALPIAYSGAVYACMLRANFVFEKWIAATTGAGIALASLYTGCAIGFMQGGFGALLFVLLYSFVAMPVGACLGLLARLFCSAERTNPKAIEIPAWLPVFFILLLPLVFKLADLFGSGHSAPMLGFDLVQTFLLGLLILWWIDNDASSRGYPVGNLFKTIVFLLTPIGLLLYLFRYRAFRAATAATGWALGVLAVYVGSSMAIALALTPG